MKMPRATTTHGVAVLVFIAVLLSRCEAEVSISCPQVILEIAPCATFLQQNSMKKPSQACCDGVKKLSGDAGTQKDRTAICQCLKEGLAKIGKYDPKRITLLPKECGVSVKLPPIDQKTDCSKV